MKRRVFESPHIPMGISPYGNRTILVDVVLGDRSETASGVLVFSHFCSLISCVRFFQDERVLSIVFHVFFTFYFLIFHFSITLVGLCLIPTFLHVFERDTPMDLVIGKWLFSNVFLCGQFQYTVLNRWNFSVLRFSLLLCGQFQYMLY